MQYLNKSFTVAVSNPKKAPRDPEAEEKRREEAKKPHEFAGGMMCVHCGLGSQAPIHRTPSINAVAEGMSTFSS